MKIETELLEDQQAKLTVEVEAESLEAAKHRAARKIASKTKIPGFRPGKAPYHIVQRHVGDDVILEEGLELLVNEVYPQVLQESKLQPYGPGKFEGVKSTEPLTLEFVVPLMAEVTLGDYHSLRFPYDAPEINAEQVDRVIRNLRERQAVEEPANRPAETGDRVHLRISGKLKETQDERDATLIHERPLSVVILPDGVEDEDEWPFSGFNHQLAGLSTGEKKTLEYVFPEDEDVPALAGAEAEFLIEIEEIKSRKLPELNGEFAKSIGEYETLEALRDEISQSLEREAVENYHSEYDDQVVKAAVEQATIKYPPQMVEHEIDEVIEQLEQRLKGQNLDLETYQKTRNIDEQGLRDEARPVAENRVRRALVLFEIADAENIQVKKEDLQTETERTLDAMTRFMSESELKKMSSQNLLPNLVGNILAEMRIDRTLERLRLIARGLPYGESSPEAGALEDAGPSSDAESPSSSSPAEETQTANVVETTETIIPKEPD